MVYSWFMGGVRVRSQSAPDRKGWVPHLGVLLVHGWGEGEEHLIEGWVTLVYCWYMGGVRVRSQKPRVSS